MGRPILCTDLILCLDFDGVLHSYVSGWKGAAVIPDPPVPGAMRFIAEALNHFDVHVFSTRSGQEGGLEAMRSWLHGWLCAEFQGDGNDIFDALKFPLEKPAAFITIDDRALTFDGAWPSMETLRNFRPWNSGKRRACP